MKTIFSKTKLLLIAIILFVGATATFAGDNPTPAFITLTNVKAGTLRKLIPESKKYKITNLKLTGELNADDIMLIREMGGCINPDDFPNRYDGKLQNLDISGTDFVGDGKLTIAKSTMNVETSKVKTSLEKYEYIFCGMEILRTIKLPMELSKIGNSFFYECSNLVSVTLPTNLKNFSPNSFVCCGKLTSIKMDASNRYFLSEDSVLFNKDKTELIWAANITNYVIPESVQRIGDYCFFSYCSGLTSLTLPSRLQEIGDLAFCGCSGLTSLTLPSGLQKIGDRAFYGCSGLTSLTLPSGLQKINECAFSYCTLLTSLTLPSGLKEIGNSAFFGCDSISSIYAYMPNPSAISAYGAFTPEVKRHAILYVPVDSYQYYWLSDEWSAFAHIKTFDPTPVESVITTDKVSEVARYSVGGQRQGSSVKGLNIVKMSDGTVRKVVVK